jgi:uncharacterized membrane protein
LWRRLARSRIAGAMRPLLLANLSSVVAMTGIIWLVQWVVYPQMGYADGPNYGEYHAFHTRAITPIVGPLMLVELGTSLVLAAVYTQKTDRWLAGAGLVLTIVCFIATALWSVPRHGQLAMGFDASVHRALVQSNWVRTTAWSLHAIVVGALALRAN